MPFVINVIPTLRRRAMQLKTLAKHAPTLVHTDEAVTSGTWSGTKSTRTPHCFNASKIAPNACQSGFRLREHVRLAVARAVCIVALAVLSQVSNSHTHPIAVGVRMVGRTDRSNGQRGPEYPPRIHWTTYLNNSAPDKALARKTPSRSGP